jgi:signal transduction histidine kinase
MRLLPRSLFGRLMLVLASGLIFAQLLSAAINFVERDSLLVRASGMQPAQRIADIVRLLDSFSPAERVRIVGILNVPPLVVSLDRAPSAEDPAPAGGSHAAMFSAVLRAALGDERPLRVTMNGTPPAWAPGPASASGHFPMGGPMGTAGMHRFPPDGVSILAQIRLQDGTWATFDTHVTQESANLPWRLLVTLLILLAAVLLLSYIAVRWVTRPLHLLASAADDFGRDINRPPLPEGGPLEVNRAAHAFNTMQIRIVRFIDERTRLLTAMSHDLKTPLTRMRLRAEMLDDEKLRESFETDVLEMEAMVTQTLEFMRGLSNREPEQNVDVMGLLESLQADNEAMGRMVTMAGHVSKPYFGAPQFLRRCISNVIDNAITYGQRAEIQVEESAAELTIRVRDHGPGIPEDELETVFEPFYRLERSRSRETGGTGLGLSIARNIARAHGGEVRLRNHSDGGLEAILTLPWKRAPNPIVAMKPDSGKPRSRNAS